VFFSCEKHKEARPNLLLDENVKKYVMFKVNSVWMYQNSNNFEIDTIKSKEVKLWGTSDTRILHDYQVNDITFYSSYYKSNIYSESEARHIDDGFSIHNIWFENARTSKKCIFFSNRAVSDTYNYWFYPDNIVTYQQFLPTYTLKSKTYTDVMVFESRYTGASIPFDDARLPVKVWYAKHVGIIRKEMSNGDVWNLISYDVKQ
jgi:hypothetical protein